MNIMLDDQFSFTHALDSLDANKDAFESQISKNISLSKQEFTNRLFLYFTEDFLIEFELAVFSYQRILKNFQEMTKQLDYDNTFVIQKLEAKRALWEQEHSLDRKAFDSFIAIIWDDMNANLKNNINLNGIDCVIYYRYIFIHHQDLQPRCDSTL